MHLKHVTLMVAALHASTAVAARGNMRILPRVLPSPELPAPTLTVQSLNLRQAQAPLQACPEDLRQDPKKCSDCGGDSKKPGICDQLLITGNQDGCGPNGCGKYCKCIPDGAVVVPDNPDTQIPIQICPESINQPIKKCTDCGGEDPAKKGTCKNILRSGPQAGCEPLGCGYICQCDNGSLEASSTDPAASSTSTAAPPAGTAGTVLVTTDISGTAVTETWALTTYSQWSSLRAHTHVTTTTENNGVETAVVLALFAGGVGYSFAGLSVPLAAGAIALLASPETNPDPEKNKDDEKCQPEPKCQADCGGKNEVGLCKAGEKANCPCEDDKKCDEQPPQCSAQDCAGDENVLQCKSQAKEGCACCPKELSCTSNDCNAKDGKCQGGNSKGCACSDGASARIGCKNRHPDASPGRRAQAAKDIFQKVFNSDWSLLLNDKSGTGGGTDGGDQTKPPTCDKNTNFGLSPSQLNELATRFCATIKDDTTDQKMDLGGADLNPSIDTKGSFATFKYTKVAGQKCSIECTEGYKKIVQSCQADSHSFYGGGSYEPGCAVWSLQMGQTQLDPSSSSSSLAPTKTQPPADVGYATGKCSVTVMLAKGKHHGLELVKIKDDAGHDISEGVELRDTTEQNPIALSSKLPVLLLLWWRPGDEVEFRYGSQAWSSEEKFRYHWNYERGRPDETKGDHLPGLSMSYNGGWGSCLQDRYTGSDCKYMSIWWYC